MAIALSRRLRGAARRGSSAPWLGPVALGAALVIASGVAARLLDTTSSDLDGFFWPSAEIAAHGHPLLVYTVRSGVYPDANGPLGLIPLTLVAMLANALGVADTLPVRDALAQACFAIFTLLMAREAMLAVAAGRGGLSRRTLTTLLFLILPPLWVATIAFGHVEAPLELWLVLLGVRLLGRGATLPAGICLGLAALTRSLAILTLIPLLIALLADRHPLRALILAGSAALTVAIGLFPFWLGDRQDLVYSLLTYRGTLGITGGTLWFAFSGAGWIGFIKADDTWIFLGTAAVLSALATLRWRDRRLLPPGVHGTLAVVTLCAPMLAKTSWPYYLLDPCVLATIWWLARPGPVVSWRGLAPLLLAVGGAVLGGLEQSQPLAPLPP